MNPTSISIRHVWFDWDEASQTVFCRLPQMDPRPVKLATVDDLMRLVRLTTGAFLPTSEEDGRADYRFAGGELLIWDDVVVAVDHDGNHINAWRADELQCFAWEVIQALAYLQHHHPASHASSHAE